MPLCWPQKATKRDKHLWAGNLQMSKLDCYRNVSNASSLIILKWLTRRSLQEHLARTSRGVWAPRLVPGGVDDHFSELQAMARGCGLFGIPQRDKKQPHRIRMIGATVSHIWIVAPLYYYIQIWQTVRNSSFSDLIAISSLGIYMKDSDLDMTVSIW